MTDQGVLFHAKHAFMPNNLGYCGPDEGGRLQEALEEGRAIDGLVRTLQRFEAAYPFLKLIARETGRDSFDLEVPEAYWVGNGLLEKVPLPAHYEFTHRELKGRDPRGVRDFFREVDGEALPHHTFYVLGTFASSMAPDGQSLTNEKTKKVLDVMDSCRISWGTVKEVHKGELEVVSRPLAMKGEGLALSEEKAKRVRYNPLVRPFQSVKRGDVVSLHWNYACEVLSKSQIRGIAKYTATDIASVNRYLRSRS